MTTPYPAPVEYPFNVPAGPSLHEHYKNAQRAPGMIRVQLPYGEPAWLATRGRDVRLVLWDKRFSRAVTLADRFSICCPAN